MARNASAARLQAILAQLPKEVKAPVLAATLRQAQILSGSMRLRVPVGGPDDPRRGALRDSIRVEKGRKEMVFLVRAGGPTTTLASGRSAFSQGFFGLGDYDYSIGQEFGTAKMPPQPFFWPSYRLHKAEIRRSIKQAAKTAIKANWKA